MKTTSRFARALIGVGMALCAHLSDAAELTVNTGSSTTLTTEQLLARHDVKSITVHADVTYGGDQTYRAVPLRTLPGIDTLRDDQDLKITASDGFVTNLPAALVHASKGAHAEPWIAIETTDKPWPLLKDGHSAGAFYLVWLHPEASKISSEQWPYRISSLSAEASHASRFPQIQVGSEVPAGSPVRLGQHVFATQCMTCHTMNGAGDAKIAPDLNLPHNPVEYFQPWALRQYIRDPRSIRAWPDMKMPAFPASSLSDADLDAIVAYLKYMAAHRR